MSVLLGITAALLAAVSYAAGVTLQSIEARKTSSEVSLRPSLLGDLLRRKTWLLGTACVVAGWVLQAVALMLAPITVVQPALAVSVVALLAIAVRFFDQPLRMKEALPAAAIIVGVTGLLLTAPAHGEGDADPVVLAIGLTALAAVALAPYLLRGRREFGVLVALSAGLAYAWCGFSTKFVADGLAGGSIPMAAVWLGATALAALVGLLSEMTALQKRAPIQVFPIVLVVQILVAVLLAPLLAGEQWSPNALKVVGLVASVAVVAAGARALARSKAVGEVVASDDDDGDEPEPRKSAGAPVTARLQRAS